MRSKTYLQMFFYILGFIFIFSILYAYYFSRNYPLPLTSRVSLDAKIKFIRENINLNDIDTLVVGSSMALNNVRGAELEVSSKVCKGVLNISTYAANPGKVAQTLELIELFPNLERIIYSVQYFDFHGVSKFREYDVDMIKKYIGNTLSMEERFKVFFNATKNIPFLMFRHFEWETLHAQSNKFTYLGFDKTGSSPLQMYGDDILPNRWKYSSWFPHHTKKPYKVLGKILREAHKNELKFYFIQQPYRTGLIKKHPNLNTEINWFLNKTEKIVESNNGIFLSLQKSLPLSNKYYADRAHLNAEGSTLSTKAIAKFIDKVEKK